MQEGAKDRFRPNFRNALGGEELVEEAVRHRTFFDSRDDGDDLAEQGLRVLSFGKHAGKTFKEVFKSHRPYCIWAVAELAGNPMNAGGPLEPLVEYVMSREPTILEDLEHTMAVGKHQTRRYEDILEDDPAYCGYVLDLVGKEPDAFLPMRMFAEWLRRNVPDLESRLHHRVEFGKYRGLRYEEVLQKDPDYCRWVAAQREKVWTASFAAWIRAQTNVTDLVDDGKYAGLDPAAIFEKNPLYCQAVLRKVRSQQCSERELQLVEYLGESQPQLEPLAEDQVAFGQYIGRHFEEVLEEDVPYCAWVAENLNNSFAEWLRDQFGSMEGRMTVGKHAGEEYAEILNSDPRYCRYVLREVVERPADAGLAFKKFAAFLGEEEPRLKPLEDNELAFGKHAGRFFEEVLKEDISYCMYVVRQSATDDKSAGYMADFAQWIRTKLGNVEGRMMSGTYAGEEYAAILENDPIYCRHVLREVAQETERATQAFKELAAFLKAEDPQLKPLEDNVLHSGRYQGLTFEEVWKADFPYCDYMATTWPKTRIGKWVREQISGLSAAAEAP